MRGDEQTDMTKLIVAFRNFANPPKNDVASTAIQGNAHLLCSTVQVTSYYWCQQTYQNGHIRQTNINSGSTDEDGAGMDNLLKRARAEPSANVCSITGRIGVFSSPQRLSPAQPPAQTILSPERKWPAGHEADVT
jgi:hypothetical protein